MDLAPNITVNEESLRPNMYTCFQNYLINYGEYDAKYFGPTRKMDLITLINTLLEIQKCVDNLKLFSINEELDDINSKDLIFLLIPFFLGDLYCNITQDLENRKSNLELSLRYWESYISTLERLEFLSKAEKEKLKQSEASDPAAIRYFKIENRRKLQESKDAIDLILQKLSLKNNNFLISISEDEEIERTLILRLMQRSKLLVLDGMDMTLREIELINFSNTKKKEPLKKIECSKNTPLPIQTKYTTNIFKPYHEPSSVSLAEVAKWEMEIEVNTLKATPFKSKKNSDDESSSTTSESETKEYKQRNWDDWADENPKGWGNKMVNRG